MLESHRGCLVFGRLQERPAGWPLVNNTMLKCVLVITQGLRVRDFGHCVGGKWSASVRVRSNLFTLLFWQKCCFAKNRKRIPLRKVIRKELAMVNWYVTVPVACDESLNLIRNKMYFYKWFLQCINLFRTVLSVKVIGWLWTTSCFVFCLRLQ